MSSILKTIDCIECSMARLSHSEKNKKTSTLLVGYNG